MVRKNKNNGYITFRFDERGFPASLFRGRLSRSQFIFSLGMLSVLDYIVEQVTNYMSGYIQSEPTYFAHLSQVSTYTAITSVVTVFGMLIIGVILLLFLGILLISFFSKRYHDIGKSGYWGLLSIVPVFNAVIGIYLIFKKGTRGPNKYGAPPSTFLI